MQTTYELKRGILFMEKVVMHEEEKRLRDLFESVQYDSDLFKVYVGRGKIHYGIYVPSLE